MTRSRFLLVVLLLAAAACKDSPTEPRPDPSVDYREGELHSFNVNTRSSCENPDYRTGRVIAISSRAIVIADTANPSGPGTFTEADYRNFARRFDELVWPSNIHNFGEPSDIDRNSRVVIFFTRAVNELTPAGQNWFVGGFFFSRDLFPRQSQPGFTGCPGSNYAEMFYMLVPDPQGTINENPRRIDRELRGSVAVLAHEFQHLINASRRLHVLQVGANWHEETWLNEGLSHVAEELLAYASSTLAPRQNIDGDRLATAGPEQTAFLDFVSPNFARLAGYLQNPEGTSPMGPDSLATRGAAWQFLRYAADRRVGTESQFWRALVNTGLSGLANLRNVLGEEPMNWLHDWTIANYTDDAVPGVANRFVHPSWNYRSIYPRLRSGSGQPLYGGYPLKTTALASGVPTSVEVAGGSAAYLRFGVAPGTRAELRLTQGPPSCLTNGPAISLAVGQVHTVGLEQAGTLCIAGGETGGEFTYIPFFASEVGTARTALTVAPTGVIAVLGPPTPSIAAAAAPSLAALLHPAGATPARQWEQLLREREIRELTPLVAGAAAPRLSTSISFQTATDPSLLRISIVRTR